MSNLIISILAIGLAAVMAIAGIFYGGSAFMTSSYKAQAGQIVNFLNAYNQAISVWSQRNGGTVPVPASNYPVTAGTAADRFTKTEIDSFLVPRYMQKNTFPAKLLAIPPNAQSTFFYYIRSTNVNPLILGFLGPNDIQTCNAIEAMRTGTWPASLRTYNNGTGITTNKSFCGSFGCLISNSSFGSVTVYTYVVYFRVHGPPENATDVDPKTCT